LVDSVLVSAAPVSFRDYDDDHLSRDEVERRYRTLIEQLPLVVYVDALDAVSSNIFTSPQVEPLLGYSVEEWKSDTDLFARLLHPEDRERLEMALTVHLQGQTEHFEHEHRMLHQNGTYRWVLSRGLAVRDSAGNVTRMAGSQTDITERKVADGLTGLPNRILFMDRLDRALDRAKRHKNAMFAVLFLDLDRVKVINDSLGHDVGDQLLIALARRLETSLRSSDTVARLVGRPTMARRKASKIDIDCAAADKRGRTTPRCGEHNYPAVCSSRKTEAILGN